MKKCIICNEGKNLSEYHKDKSKKDGLSNKCKSCVKSYQKTYQKEYRKLNVDKIKENRKELYNNNKEYEKLVCETYRKNNPILFKTIVNKWRKNNPEKIKEYSKTYYKNNKGKINEYQKNYNKKRKLEPIFKLKANIRTMVSNVITNNNFIKRSKTVDILGCSFEDFKIHLESKFEDWMNWENYGKYNGSEEFGWDIDHIIPISTAKTEDDVIRLNHYTNLQPLCSYTNRVLKSNKNTFL